MRIAALAVSALILLPLAACGDEQSDAPTKPTASVSQQSKGTIPVSLGEWYVQPTARASGDKKVSFDVANNGKQEHEMVVVRTDDSPDALPLKGNTAEEEKAGSVPGEVEDIKPGSSKRLHLKLKPGHYALICNIPGHYKAGMHAAFTVR